MSQKPKPILMLFFVGLAIILAAVLFLAVRAVQNRSETAVSEGEGVQTAVSGETINVAGQEIVVNRDASKAVRLLTPEEQIVEAAQPEPAAEPETAPTETPVPAEPVITAVPVQEVATAVDKIITVSLPIVSGDTLYSISQRIDTSIALMADRGISQDDLVPGTNIPLPIGNPAYCIDGRRPYAVGEGDTAFSIGQKFNIKAEELQTINKLDDAFTVRVADILCVP